MIIYRIDIDVGLNAETIGRDLTRVTAEWSGLKVKCKLTIRNKHVKYDCIPDTRSLITKELADAASSADASSSIVSSSSGSDAAINMATSPPNADVNSQSTVPDSLNIGATRSSAGGSVRQVVGSRYRGNLTLTQVIRIAQRKLPELTARDMKGAVKTILGTCQATRITVDGRHPHDISDLIEDGEIEVPDPNQIS